VLRNNMLSIYIAPNAYDAQGAVAREVTRFVAWVKASPPLNPDAPVLLPGEVERKTRAERTAQGIPLDDKTHADLLAAAASVGIASDRAEAMIA
jgi:uncharacterized oxidoreductase